MDIVTVAGDGAVGTAVAVALAVKYRVVLAGPPGTPEETAKFCISGDFRSSAEFLHTSVDSIPDSSAIVAALKAYDIRETAPLITGRGPIVCLSNGMGLEEEWGPAAGNVEYAVLSSGFVFTSRRDILTSDGAVHCEAGGVAEELFAGTVFRTEPVVSIELMRWAKWYANSIINPLGALTGLPNNLIRDSDMGFLIQKLENELSLCMPSQDSIKEGRLLLQRLLAGSTNRCSMLQDVLAERKTEIDFLTGLCSGKFPGSCPVASRLTNDVKSISRRNLSGH